MKSKYIIERFSKIAFIRYLQYFLLVLILFFLWILYVFLHILGYIFLNIELYFFILILGLILVLIIFTTSYLVEALSELKGLDKAMTLKYTDYLQRRLRRIVPSNAVTGNESLQSISSKKLNWLAHQSFIVVDKKGNLALAIRSGRDAELSAILGEDEIRKISSYYARLSGTHFNSPEFVTLEKGFLMKHWTTDFYVVKLLK